MQFLKVMVTLCMTTLWSGDNRDEEAGRSEPCYVTPHSARAPQPMKQKETLF